MEKISKCLLLLFLWFSGTVRLFCNTDNVPINDTTRLNNYCQLAIKYSETNRDSSIYFANLALGIAEKLNQKFYQASILSDLGYTLLSSGDYSNALTKLLIANTLMEDKNIGKDVIITPFFNQYFTSKDPKINRIILIGYIKNSLAMLYGRTDHMDKQLSELQEVKKIIETETNDLNLRYTINNNIANAYLNKGILDSALVYQLIVLDIEKKMVSKNYAGASNKAIGDIYFRKGNYEEAKINYLKGLNLLKKGENKYYIALSQFALADTYRKLSKMDSSLYYSKEGIKNYRILGSSVPEMEGAYSALALSFKDESKYDSAYYYLQLAKNLSDSVYDTEIKTLTDYQNIGFNEKMRLKEIETERINTKNRTQILLLLAGLTLFFFIAFILYRSNKIKVKANILLADQKRQIENTLVELKSTQAQLIQSEKMASLGELTAGIAHEIQNPLNFVNNFSELSVDLANELDDEVKKSDLDIELITDLTKDIKSNQEKINHHGKRAADIVKSMLQHSRSRSGQKEPTDINALADEYLRLAYHGLRAKDKSFNATMKTNFDPTLPKIEVVPQDIGRVLLNLITNAFYAVNEKSKKSPEINREAGFEPTVSVITTKIGNNVEIKVADNGSGIPEHIKDKIFQPFFTTKPTGQGTGLGLSLAYDIVKTHGGELKVETKEGEGSEFTIVLPLS